MNRVDQPNINAYQADLRRETLGENLTDLSISFMNDDFLHQTSSTDNNTAPQQQIMNNNDSTQFVVPMQNVFSIFEEDDADYIMD